MTFSKTLLDWYDKNARDLPWRKTKDPYFIWISEIILQQTRVDQGLPYYLRFTKTYPNLTEFYKASEDDVLKLWQGLGYYSRARNMMAAAKDIVENYNGLFPETYEKLLKLKGIGPYTAAAISSICFNLPHAVVDGNVFRVLSRYYNVDIPINTTEGKKYFDKLSQENLNPIHPGNYNQAIMEFGARMCVPSNPDCINCPLNSSCAAFAHSSVSELPVKLKKLKVKNRYLNYFFITSNDHFLIEKRGDTNIWKGLYQLPLLETVNEIDITEITESKEFQEMINHQSFKICKYDELKHKLTHRLLHIRIYHLKIKDLSPLDFMKIPLTKYDNYAFPKPIHKYLNEMIK